MKTKVRFDTSDYTGLHYWTIGNVGPPGYKYLHSCVNSFKQVCNALDARAPFEIVGNAKEEAHKLLTK